MKMTRKEKIIFLVVLAGIVGLGVWLLYAWLYLLPEKAIERELAKIRARGEPVTLEELAPAEIPDAENAALIYEQAFAVCYEPPGKEGIHLSDISGKDLAEWIEEDIEAIRENLEKNQDCLRLIHQAANYDKCRFDIDYSLGYLTFLHHHSEMRESARLLARDALLKAKEGKIDKALESTWVGLRLSKALLDEPIFLSQLVRHTSDRIILSVLQRILDESDASSEILRCLLDELNIEEGRAAFTRGLQGERCSQIDFFEALIKDPSRFWQMMQRLSGGAPQPPVSGKGYGIMLGLARPIFRRNELFALSSMRRMIDLSRLPYHRVKADLDKLGQDLDEAPKYCVFSATLIFALTRSHLQEARHEARIGLAQLALALKIYKAEEGKYPDALAELVPEILPELPQDPFTGKDFVYKKEGEGFLVYSLGENGTDEGGKWDEKNRYQHDIPWRSQR